MTHSEVQAQGRERFREKVSPPTCPPLLFMAPKALLASMPSPQPHGWGGNIAGQMAPGSRCSGIKGRAAH